MISKSKSSAADIAASKAKIFTTFDLLKGYHQCPLDEECQKLTTFITSFGRYQFLRAPYEVYSISEHYDRRMDSAFKGLSGFPRVVDDVVSFNNDGDEHVKHVSKSLTCCQEKGISLNRDKFKFGQQEVLFAGFQLKRDGYLISDDITRTIWNPLVPSSRTDL